MAEGNPEEITEPLMVNADTLADDSFVQSIKRESYLPLRIALSLIVDRWMDSPSNGTAIFLLSLKKRCEIDFYGYDSFNDHRELCYVSLAATQQ